MGLGYFVMGGILGIVASGIFWRWYAERSRQQAYNMGFSDGYAEGGYGSEEADIFFGLQEVD